MTQHVHFNLDDFRKAHASTVGQMRAQLELSGHSEETKSYHELSFKLLDQLVELTIICFDARNNGTGELVIANALGTALGNHAGSYMSQVSAQGMFQPAMTMHLMMTRAIQQHMSEQPLPGTVSGESVIHPMQGGHA